MFMTASVAPRWPPPTTQVLRDLATCHSALLAVGVASSKTCGRVKVSGFHSPPALWVQQGVFVSLLVQIPTTAVFTPTTQTKFRSQQFYSSTSFCFFFFLSLAAASISREDAKCSSKTNTSQTFGVNLMFLKSGFNALPSENELQTTP